MIIGAIVCLNPFWLIFGLPILLVGIVLTISSKKIEKGTKLKWIFYPIIGVVLIIGAFIGLLYLCTIFDWF